MPVYEDIDVRDVIYSKNNISAIESRFSITFERDDTELKGDGILNVSRNGDLNLRIYSFGFLAFELISENGIVKNTPAIDRNKAAIFAYGLRDCFFWWDLNDFEVEEQEDSYIIQNLSRKLWVNRKTISPVKQIIFLQDGRKLDIYYNDPRQENEIWYPSRIRIEHARSSVTLKIKDISFIPGV
ncbi:MAG: hypothetical protein IBX72_01190 [Nitrospirae bacterium]|nr:hypothetical protein [Nitrospirota bacterium]